MRNFKNSKMMLIVFVIIPLLFPKYYRSRQIWQGMVQKAHLVIFPSVSVELWHKFESSSCFPSNSFLSCFNICELLFAILNCYPRLDGIAASLLENNWLSWQIVSDDKIQLTLMILGRGALSIHARIRTFSSRRCLFLPTAKNFT